MVERLKSKTEKCEQIKLIYSDIHRDVVETTIVFTVEKTSCVRVVDVSWKLFWFTIEKQLIR